MKKLTVDTIIDLLRLKIIKDTEILFGFVNFY